MEKYRPGQVKIKEIKMIRKIMAVVFALMLAVSLGWLGAIAWQENVSGADHDEAAQLANASPATVSAELSATGKIYVDDAARVNVYTDDQIDELRDMDIEALKKINSEVMGWIRIPDTEIDYPLLRGEDNKHYLKHNWKNKPNSAGAIFMEHANAKDLSDFNTIIYGHNMRSGSMFGSLKEYADQAYWEAHPHIYIINDNGVFRYDIFAAHRVRPGTITYGMQIPPQLQAEFICCALENSKIQTNIRPAVGDRILTLSTCTGDSAYRWVVQGVLNQDQSYHKDLP